MALWEKAELVDKSKACIHAVMTSTTVNMYGALGKSKASFYERLVRNTSHISANYTRLWRCLIRVRGSSSVNLRATTLMPTAQLRTRFQSKTSFLLTRTKTVLAVSCSLRCTSCQSMCAKSWMQLPWYSKQNCEKGAAERFLALTIFVLDSTVCPLSLAWRAEGSA